MYDTRKVIAVDIRYPFSLLPNLQQMMSVNPELGLLHHYVAEPPQLFTKYPQQRNRYVEDLTMLRYADALETAVQQRNMRIAKNHNVD